MVGTVVAAGQVHLAKFTPRRVSDVLKGGNAERAMEDANRALQLQNTATGPSGLAWLRPGLTSVNSVRVIGAVGIVAAAGYTFMQDGQEGQSTTRAAVTTAAQTASDWYISGTTAESGMETGAIIGSFVGPEGTVIGGACLPAQCSVAVFGGPRFILARNATGSARRSAARPARNNGSATEIAGPGPSWCPRGAPSRRHRPRPRSPRCVVRAPPP